MKKIVLIAATAMFALFLTGCAKENVNATTPSSWHNIKEDRYAIYDVAEYEEEFIQNLDEIMDSLNPSALNSAPAKRKDKDELKKYF